LTGTPGAGKTAILPQFEIEGFRRYRGAATDVIAPEQAKGVAEPWLQDGFLDMVVDLQRRRLHGAGAGGGGLQKLHEEMYRRRGFELVPIEPGAVLDRVAAIRRAL
jgi:predicted ATPase